MTLIFRIGIFTLVLLICCTVFAEESKVGKLHECDSDLNYWEKPKIFLHLNKTSFLPGENLWFTAYLYDLETDLPDNEAKNLYCGIYDSKGQPLAKSIFHFEGGSTYGQFEIKAEYGNTIYLKAFLQAEGVPDEKSRFLQTIFIEPREVKPPSETIYEDYDITLSPESGKLIVGIENTIGFKVRNSNNHGVPVTNGQIRVKGSTPLKYGIVSNPYGVGKFTFYYEPDKEYEFVVELPDGQLISKAIPTGLRTGVTVSLNNLFEDKLLVDVRTNATTLESIRNDEFFVAIHRDGHLSASTFKMQNSQEIVQFEKQNIAPGVNILTLFDSDLRPICERLFFNEKGVKLGELSFNASPIGKSGDSLTLDIRPTIKKMDSLQLSVSILPSGSRGNNPSNNIATAFLIDPYIRGRVENGPHYLKDFHRKRLYELDNLLITKGWGAYEWQSIFDDNNKQKVPTFTNGFTLNGSVDNANQNRSKLLVHDILSNNQTFAEVDDKKELRANNVIVYKDSPLLAYLFNEKGKFLKPDVDLQVLDDFPNIPLKSIEMNNSHRPNHFPYYKTELNMALGTVMLENVTVTDKLAPRIFKVPGGLTGYKVTDEGGTISGFIRRYGFQTIFNPKSGLMAASKASGGAYVSIDGYSEEGGQFFDGSLRDVDYIIYKATGGNHFFSIVTKRPSLEKVAKILLEKGFERPKGFYNPPHIEENFEDYALFAPLHWSPWVEIANSDGASIKFSHKGNEEILVHVEGMASDGTLFSSLEMVPLR